MSREHFVRLRGAWDVRHWIAVPALRHEADGLQLERRLMEMSGMHLVQAYPDSGRIRVTYDQTRTDFESVLQTLEETGFPASATWWWRKKTQWFQYLDATARMNANLPPAPCCSNPKGVNTGKRRIHE